MKIKEVATPTHLLPTMTVALNVLYHPSELLLCFLSQVLYKLIFLHQSKFFLDEFKKNLCDVHSAGNLSVYHQNSISLYAKCNNWLCYVFICVMLKNNFYAVTIFIVTGREESDNDHQRLVESGKTVLILFWANLSPAPWIIEAVPLVSSHLQTTYRLFSQSLPGWERLSSI